MLYDPGRRTGFLYNALYNDTKKKRKAQSAIDLPNNEENLSEEYKENVLKFLKRCALSDRKEVEKRLAETKTFRRELILRDLEKYQSCWNFYFHMPDLVSDFENRKK